MKDVVFSAESLRGIEIYLRNIKSITAIMYVSNFFSGHYPKPFGVNPTFHVQQSNACLPIRQIATDSRFPWQNLGAIYLYRYIFPQFACP